MSPTRPPVLSDRVPFGPKKIRFGRNKQLKTFSLESRQHNFIFSEGQCALNKKMTTKLSF